MASTSGASNASGSAAQHIDVDNVEPGVESEVSMMATEVVDDEMAGDTTSVAQGTQTPLSATAEPQDESHLAASFYQSSSSSSSSNKRQSVSKPANFKPIVVNDQDEDDLMEPDLPGREERLLDEKIRARYIQEIGDIF